MKMRPLVLAALGAVFVLGAVAPASAYYDDWRRREWREWREHEWWEHHRHYHHWYGDNYRYYYGPRY